MLKRGAETTFDFVNRFDAADRNVEASQNDGGHLEPFEQHEIDMPMRFFQRKMLDQRILDQIRQPIIDIVVGLGIIGIVEFVRVAAT